MTCDPGKDSRLIRGQRNFGKKWGNGAFGRKWGKKRKEVKAANFAISKGSPIKRSSVIAVILTKSSHYSETEIPGIFADFFPVLLVIFLVLVTEYQYALDFTLATSLCQLK